MGKGKAVVLGHQGLTEYMGYNLEVTHEASSDKTMDEELLKSFSPLDVSEAFKQYYQSQRDVSVRAATTPLHVAVLDSNLERTRRLLESRRVAPTAPDSNGYTALHHAALLGREQFTQLLIEHGADANAIAYDGNTPLHKAAQGGHVAIAKLLLAHGAQVNATNALRERPIDACAKRKHTAMTMFLRGYDGDHNQC